MKKFLLIPLAALFALAGCTSKEQTQQIRLFWLQQYTNFMMKQLTAKQQKLANDPRLKEFAAMLKQNNQPVSPNASVQNVPKRPAQPQIMEVTLETDTLPGKASQTDRTRMKRALEAVQLSNQNTLADIDATFGSQVKYQAFLLTTKTERQLKQIAAQSANFTAYFAQQQKLLKEQERQINELLQNNTASIKKLRR